MHHKIAVIYQIIVFLKFQVGSAASPAAPPFHVCFTITDAHDNAVVTGSLCGPACTLSVGNPPTHSEMVCQGAQCPPPPPTPNKSVYVGGDSVYTPGFAILLCSEQECLTKTAQMTFVRVYTSSVYAILPIKCAAVTSQVSKWTFPEEQGLKRPFFPPRSHIKGEGFIRFLNTSEASACVCVLSHSTENKRTYFICKGHF